MGLLLVSFWLLITFRSYGLFIQLEDTSQSCYIFSQVMNFTGLLRPLREKNAIDSSPVLILHSSWYKLLFLFKRYSSCLNMLSWSRSLLICFRPWSSGGSYWLTLFCTVPVYFLPRPEGISTSSGGSLPKGTLVAENGRSYLDNSNLGVNF